MQYMVVFLADISKKYYLCRYNVTIKLADRWKTNTIGVTDEAINVYGTGRTSKDIWPIPA